MISFGVWKGLVVAVEIEWCGRRESGPTQLEERFASMLAAKVGDLQFWLHEDDGVPWMIVSLDQMEGQHVVRTLRLDFDAAGARGGWSKGLLNWDDGVRAERAEVEFEGESGLVLRSDAESLESLSDKAAVWFLQHTH